MLTWDLLIGEGNGNLLQCSCLENPRDSGARWAAVYGVAWSQTRLKQLSSSSSSSRDLLTRESLSESSEDRFTCERSKHSCVSFQDKGLHMDSLHSPTRWVVGYCDPLSCRMWEMDYKESWAPKNWCFWTVVLEKTLESPLDCEEIHSVHPTENQSWIFFGKTDVEAETPVL